jgi:arylformamidase
MALIDISLPIREGMIVYEGDPGISVKPSAQMGKGDPANVSALNFGTHTGTHMDAPLHFIEGAAGIDAVPLDLLIGPALVLEVDAETLVEPKHLTDARIASHQRVLLKTRNSKLWDRPSFAREYVGLSLEGARLLIERGVKLVGIDYLSVEAYGVTGHPVHKTLLGAGMVILEGLDFRRVTPGVYELYCLPLRIAGGDGAPCRAVLRG